MKFLVRLQEGELIPPFHGVAWVEFMSNRAVCLPIPLNVVAGSLRSIWFWLRGGWRPVPVNPRDAFREGYVIGYQHGSMKAGEPL